MKGILVRLESTNNNLRTNEIEGEYDKVPTPGEPFVLIGEPLDPRAHFRMVTTSTVQDVEHFPDKIRFTTRNSTYELYT